MERPGEPKEAGSQEQQTSMITPSSEGEETPSSPLDQDLQETLETPLHSENDGAKARPQEATPALEKKPNQGAKNDSDKAKENVSSRMSAKSPRQKAKQRKKTKRDMKRKSKTAHAGEDQKNGAQHQPSSSDNQSQGSHCEPESTDFTMSDSSSVSSLTRDSVLDPDGLNPAQSDAGGTQGDGGLNTAKNPDDGTQGDNASRDSFQADADANQDSHPLNSNPSLETTGTPDKDATKAEESESTTDGDGNTKNPQEVPKDQTSFAGEEGQQEGDEKEEKRQAVNGSNKENGGVIVNEISDLPQKTEAGDQAQNGSQHQSDLERTPRGTDAVRPISETAENNKILMQTEANTAENPKEPNGGCNSPKDTGTASAEDAQETNRTQPGTTAKDILSAHGGGEETDGESPARTEIPTPEQTTPPSELGKQTTVRPKDETSDHTTSFDSELGVTPVTVFAKPNNDPADVEPSTTDPIVASAKSKTGVSEHNKDGDPGEEEEEEEEEEETEEGRRRRQQQQQDEEKHSVSDNNGGGYSGKDEKSPTVVNGSNDKTEKIIEGQVPKMDREQGDLSTGTEVPGSSASPSVESGERGGDDVDSSGTRVSFPSPGPSPFPSFTFGQTSTPRGSEDTRSNRSSQPATATNTAGHPPIIQPSKLKFAAMTPGKLFAGDNSSSPRPPAQGQGNAWPTMPGSCFNNNHGLGNSFAFGGFQPSQQNPFGSSSMVGPYPAEGPDFNGLGGRSPPDTGLLAAHQKVVDGSANIGSVSARKHYDSTVGKTNFTESFTEDFGGSAHLHQDSGRGDSLSTSTGTSDHFDDPKEDHTLMRTETGSQIADSSGQQKAYGGSVEGSSPNGQHTPQPHKTAFSEVTSSSKEKAMDLGGLSECEAPLSEGTNGSSGDHSWLQTSRSEEGLRGLQAHLSQVLQELDHQREMTQQEKKNGERLTAECDRLKGDIESLKTVCQNKDEQIKGLRVAATEQRQKLAPIEELEKANNELQRQLSELQQRCTSQETTLTEQMEKLSTERQSHAEDICYQQTQQRELSRRLEELQQTSQKEIARLTENRNAQSADRETLSGRVQELTEEKSCLETTLNRLEGEMQRLKANLLDKTREEESLRRQQSELTTSRDSLDTHCHGLQADMAELNKEMDRLQRANADLQEQVENLRKAGEAKETQIAALTTTITQGRQIVTSAEEMAASYGEAKERLEELKQQHASIESKLAEATASNSEKETELEQTRQRHEQEVQALRSKLYEVSSERDELRTSSHGQLSQIAGDRDALRTECDKLNSLVKELTDANRSLEEGKSELEGQLRRTEEEKNNSITARNALEAQRNNSEATVRELTERTRRLEDVNRTQESQLTTLQAQVQAKENLVGGLSETVSRQERQIQAKEHLEREHANAVSLLTESQERCASLQPQVTQLTERCQHLEAALAKETDDHAREVNALKVRVHELSSELNELNQSSQTEIASLDQVRTTLRSDNDRLNVKVDELQNNKRRLEDQKRDLQERLRATERKAEELTTKCRVLEQQKRTAEEQSVTYGQAATLLQAKALEQQNLANSFRVQTETLTVQLRERMEAVLPLEMEARRLELEAQQTRERLDSVTAEKTELEGVVNALKVEADQSAAAIQAGQRREEELRGDVERQVAQKQRYVQETQQARGQIRTLEEKVRQFQLRDAQRFRSRLVSN